MSALVELISKEELTTEKLLDIYRRAYMDAELDTDGDIKLRVEGINVFAKVEPAPRYMMRLYCGFGLKPHATRPQILEFCNRINDKLIMVRAYYPESAPMPVLFLDHYLDTEAGVTAEEIVDETRRFVKVFVSIPPLDTDGILT